MPSRLPWMEGARWLLEKRFVCVAEKYLSLLECLSSLLTQPQPQPSLSSASSPKWVFVVRALVTVKGTGAANDEM